jgi:hypothetical protein
MLFLRYPVEIISAVLTIIIELLWEFKLNSLEIFKEIYNNPFYENIWHSHPPNQFYNVYEYNDWHYDSLLDCIKNNKSYINKH